ncbi:MAG: hypothetical protein AAGK21_14690, partial [Bacteroidota bacterium]
MSRRVWAGIGLLATGVGGLVASLSLGSRPTTYAAGPVPSCGDFPNCARVAVPFHQSPSEVLGAARSALVASGVVEFRETDGGVEAV